MSPKLACQTRLAKTLSVISLVVLINFGTWNVSLVC
jgi:hypothetical protein